MSTTHFSTPLPVSVRYSARLILSNFPAFSVNSSSASNMPSKSAASFFANGSKSRNQLLIGVIFAAEEIEIDALSRRL